MSDSNAKIHQSGQIRLPLGPRPRLRWGKLTALPRPPSCIYGGLLLRGGRKSEGWRREVKGFNVKLLPTRLLTLKTQRGGCSAGRHKLNLFKPQHVNYTPHYEATDRNKYRIIFWHYACDTNGPINNQTRTLLCVTLVNTIPVSYTHLTLPTKRIV